MYKFPQVSTTWLKSALHKANQGRRQYSPVMEGSGKMLWLVTIVLMDFFLMLESMCVFLAPGVQSC